MFECCCGEVRRGVEVSEVSRYLVRGEGGYRGVRTGFVD